MTMRYGVTHVAVIVERLMCCEVEFFWEVCFKEGTSGLFSLNVVPVAFHALLPDS